VGFKRPDNDVCMACSSGNKKKKRKKALIRTCFMGGGVTFGGFGF